MTMPGAGGSPANLGEISGETKTSGFFYLQNCKKIGYVVLITCSVNFFFNGIPTQADSVSSIRSKRGQSSVRMKVSKVRARAMCVTYFSVLFYNVLHNTWGAIPPSLEKLNVFYNKIVAIIY